MRASSRFLIRSSLCVLALALAGCTLLTPASPTLPTGFAQALQDAGVPVSAVALQVQAVDRIAPLRSHNASLPMKPASIMKLVTTSAALDLLGPAYRWTTRVYADGVQTGELLQGDLIIQGGGDPRLAHEDLWRLLRRLRAQGLREIRGDLILDRSLFAITEQDAAQFDAQPLRPYNALPDALLLDGKALTLRFLPDAASQRVQVSSEPLLAGLELIAPALSHTDCQDWRSGLGTTFESGVLRFTGSYPLSCGEQRYPIHAVGLTHAGYFDAVLRQIWQELGGSITGVTREGRVPASAKEIQQWQSMPLADVIGDINRNRKGQPHVTTGAAVYLRIDPDHFTTHIEERPAGISRVNCHISLEKWNKILRRQGASFRTYNTCSNRTFETKWRTDRQNPLPDFQFRRIAKANCR